MNLTGLLVDVLFVEEQNGIEILEFLGVAKLIQLVCWKRDLVELCALLLQLLVLISDDLALFLELVTKQVLKVLPEVDHLSRAELGALRQLLFLSKSVR